MPMLFPETMLLAKADRAACRDLLRDGSRSFFAASHLLPAGAREHATALYAFCRLADDAVDGGPRSTLAGGARRAAVERLRARVDRVFRGQPADFAADRAFCRVVERCALPRALPDALIEGLAWDADERRYATLTDLEAYAARVAGSVGAMMAVVMGVRERTALQQACDLGAAMQFTNIARDVGEDARAGRLYLPLDWLRAEGIDHARFLAAPEFTPALGRVVARLLGEADRLYVAGEQGIAALPAGCRPGIRAARSIYAAIGDAVAARGYDSVATRATVSATRKLALVAAAMVGPSTPSSDARSTSEARFLVEAGAILPNRQGSMLGREGSRLVWALDLLHRVELRRQALDLSA